MPENYPGDKMIRGQAPKDDDERQRRNKPIFNKIPVTWDGIVRGPDLPEDYTWCKRTIEWWETWRRTPQSMVMIETDWEVMLDAALLHNKIWSTGKFTAAEVKELRSIVACYGATFEDRRKLRLDIRTPESEKNEEAAIEAAAKEAVKDITNYKDMMNDYRQQ